MKRRKRRRAENARRVLVHMAHEQLTHRVDMLKTSTHNGVKRGQTDRAKKLTIRRGSSNFSQRTTVQQLRKKGAGGSGGAKVGSGGAKKKVGGAAPAPSSK